MKYVICPYCGAHLDFGETCDCQKDNKDTKKNVNAGAHAFINKTKEKNNG